jgi:transposase-like protein
VLRPEAKVRTSKYLNNLAEQDHRRVKQRVYPMLGFKSFANAAVTISGIEFAQQIRKGQFDTSAVIVSEGTTISSVWEAGLSV